MGFWGFGEQYVTVFADATWFSYVLLPKTPKPLKFTHKFKMEKIQQYSNQIIWAASCVTIFASAYWISVLNN